MGFINMKTKKQFVELEKDVFCLVMNMGQRKKFWVPTRNQTSDLQIQHSDALPQSHRDSMVSEVYYEVYLTCKRPAYY